MFYILLLYRMGEASVPGPGTLRCLEYSPLNITQPERDRELSRETKKIDRVFVPGTQRRQADPDLQVVTKKLQHHMEYAWGWGYYPGSNKSAGCSILVGGNSNPTMYPSHFPPKWEYRDEEGH